MNIQELIKSKLLDELADRFQTEANARVLLESISYPRRGRPQFPNNGDSLDYWTEICTQIEGGIIDSGTDLQPLIDAAFERYPGNKLFQQYRTSIPETKTGKDNNSQAINSQEFVSLLIQGSYDVEHLIDIARKIASEQERLPESIIIRFVNMEGVLIGLNNWTVEDAVPFVNRLQEVLQSEHQEILTSIATSEFCPYLISRLFIEGQDQARFEVYDVSSDTTVGVLAKGVMSQAYDSRMFQDSRGKDRPVTVDRLREDGSTERLNQDQTLHEANIQEDDTLSVAPEATAGAIHPQLRQEALARVKNQIMAYAQAHPGFQVSANNHLVPTDYLLKFNAPGFAPPLTPDTEPQLIDEHEVFLALPGAFPMIAPEVFWQTPIFHPNIEPNSGLVCLGDLGDRYRPGLDFSKLCQLLIDIASYQNYAIAEGYNIIAQRWAISEQGQIAIEKRGGQSTLRKLFQNAQKIPQLNIKRLSE